jgi:hypothetical protein
VRRTPLASHDARGTGLLRRQRLDAGGGTWTFGGEAMRRPGDVLDRLDGELGGSSAWSGRRRKTKRKGSEVSSRWLLKVLGCAGRREKKEGVWGSAPHGGENGEGRGGPGMAGAA